MGGIVVLSGGGTGIGKAVAQVFARDGGRVVIVGRRDGVLDAAAEELGAGVVPPRRRPRGGRPGDGDGPTAALARRTTWGAVAYLASPAAAHVTAQVIQVNAARFRGAADAG
jgi:3-oxoacyl-[acyl-carrier protein] reductase